MEAEEKLENFYLTSENEETDVVVPLENNKNETSVIELPVVKLFSGVELSIDNIDLVTNKYNTSLVIIIGESKSGKTTVLSSIYDMFQIGGFSKLFFAGSLTQFGLETRCHLSRVHSGTKIPDTFKTQSKDFNFLHISFKNKDNLNATAHHLLLSDISGERFTMANANAAVMTEMELLKRADHVVYLLDGDKIANKFERGGVVTRAVQFIKRAVDTSMFDTTTELHIIFTKGDILASIDNNIVDVIKKQITDQFITTLKDIFFFTVAARPSPPTDEFKFGNGLEFLLNMWINKKTTPYLGITSETLSSDRFFNKYTLNNGK